MMIPNIWEEKPTQRQRSYKIETASPCRQLEAPVYAAITLPVHCRHCHREETVRYSMYVLITYITVVMYIKRTDEAWFYFNISN
jgi:hypothetical protein